MSNEIKKPDPIKVDVAKLEQSKAAKRKILANNQIVKK